MKKTLISFLTLILLLSTSACLLTREDVKTAEERKRLSGDVVQLRRSNADAQARYDELQAQQNELQGRLEILERTAGSSNEQQKNVIQGQEEKNKIFEETLRLHERKILTLETELTSLKLEMAKSLAQIKAKAKPKEPKGNYTSAEISFKKKDWRKAILGYEKYRELNPKGRRYAEATYKMGVCFQELKLKDEAKVFYEEVINKYKNSKQAKKARVRLKQIK